MEDVTFPITKMGKKMNRILAKSMEVETSSQGSKLTLDKLEAMEKDMRKVFKEDIAFPLWEPGKCFYHPKEPAVVQSGTAAYNLCQKCLDKSLSKVIWEGREWLRSINDPNHERRMVGVMCLVLAMLYALAVYVLI